MKIDEKLLDAYYQGRCNEEESRAVEEWIQQEDYDNYHLQPINHLQDGLWNNINSKITASKSYLLYYWSAAACIALICSVFFILRFDHRATSDVQYSKVETFKGQRAKVTLSDGTVVHLNANSLLKYPAKFGAIRRVELSGEAFFDVVKMPEKPFLIAGKTTETRVLGTSFNLVERTNKRNLTVLTGKVAYKDKRTNRMLTAISNEQVSLLKDGRFEKRTVYAQKYAAWKDGKILFDNNTLQEIAATLGDWYGIKFEITNKQLARESFTGRFNKPQLGEVLQTIGFALKFKYKQKGDTILLSPE
jgi:transmembrane sensor